MAIQFVGAATDGKLGATSGTSTIALNSGLTGGIASSVSEGDLVIAVFGTGSTANRTLSITDGANAYTLIASELYSNDNVDANLRVAYKFMGSTPDTNTTFGPTGNASDAGAMAVYVFRGVDQTTPLDVAAVTATGINGVYADPPSITPSTAGSFIVCVGAGAHFAGTQTYSSSDLTDFISVGGPDDNNDATIGIGHKDDWTSGAFDAAAFTFSSGSNINLSWAAITIALRPTVTAAEGSASLTQAGNTASGSGLVPVDGDASLTQASSTLSATAALLIYAVASVTQADASVASAVTVPAKASAAVTQASQSVSSASVVSVAGTAALVQATQSVSADGKVIVSVTQGPSAAGDTAISSGVVAVEASASASSAADSVSSHADIVIEASAALTQASATLFSDATGELVSVGEAYITQSSQQSAAAAAVGISADAAPSSAGDAASGAASALVSGAGALQSAGDSSSGSGTVSLSAAASLSNAAHTVSSTMVVDPEAFGDASITQDAHFYESVAIVRTIAYPFVAVTQAGQSVAADGTVADDTLTLDAAQDGNTSSGSVSVIVDGSLDLEQGNATSSATAAVAIVAAAAGSQANTIQAEVRSGGGYIHAFCGRSGQWLERPVKHWTGTEWKEGVLYHYLEGGWSIAVNERDNLC